MRVIWISAIIFTLSTSLCYAASGMVVSENRIASAVGADILRSGGNAVDAAVAVGYALAVVNPCCGNIGGGGFMTIHLANGKDIFINFREKAPHAASKNMYLDQKGDVIPDLSVKGYLAVAIPGTVLGLDTALQKFGTMTRQQVMAPAIKLAADGFTVTPYLAKEFAQYAKYFKEQPNVAAIFLHDGKSYQAGETLKQINLSHTLSAIAANGPNAFYRGKIAEEIVAASQAHGGVLSLADFEQYNVTLTTPIHCHYQGYEIISAPLPSSGGIALCEALNILDYLPLSKSGFHHTRSAYYTIEAMNAAFYDRNSKLGDPDFVDAPVEQLLSKDYAASISRQIAQFHHHKWKGSVNVKELTDTTHYSVLDKHGNAVAVTYTINGMYGSKMMAGATGFFLNNEMDDFAAKTGVANKFGLVMQDANSIAPNKRPLSSMTPTVILKDGNVFMVVGSPGGPRIITSVLQTILNVINFHMPLQQAVDAPRFHYQNEPDTVYVEPFTFGFFTKHALALLGYEFTTQAGWSAVEAILVDPASRNTIGANDIRRPDGGAVAE
jgi:gamma-glutamyltranspeptidase/glutathione hydrolase